MNIRIQIALVILLGGLLLGCTPTEVTPTTPATAAAPVQVTRQTATPVMSEPTATPTFQPPLSTETNVPTVTQTARPAVVTPRPSATPVPSATARPVHYELPGWVSDPETVVLLSVTATGQFDESFITLNNLITGERFDMPFFSELPLGVHWFQDDSGTYLEQGRYGDMSHLNPPIEQINIATGELRILPPLEEITDRSIVAPGGRYAVRIVDDPAPKTVTMEDRETGESMILEDPFSGRLSSYVEASWSPAGDFLAVGRIAYAGEPYSAPASGLVIYRPDGSIFRWYNDYYGNTWAPYGSYRFLYQEGENFDAYVPCIFDALTGVSDCLTEVATWREESRLETYSYQWLPSGQGISFIAWDEGSSLCIIGIENRQITCPLNNQVMTPAKLTAESDTFIIDYQWSPDGRYLWLTVDSTSPRSDDRGSLRVATAAADGSQFQVLGFGYEGLWRPALNP